MPRISVAMGVYNDADRLDRAVDSILKQTYTDFEFIICDDGSRDSSYEKLQEWAAKDKRIRLLRNTENLTLAPTLNRCIELSQGEFIARMDSDDVAHSDRFDKQLAFLEAHREYAVVGSSLNLFDENGFWGCRVGEEAPLSRHFLKGNCFAHPACMFRRSALLDVGCYSTSPKHCRVEDFELFLRMYAKGYRGYNMSEPLLDYYESRNSSGRRQYRYRINNARVRYHGYRQLGLMPVGMLYVCKPLVLGLIPYELILGYHKRRYAGGS